MEKEFMEKEFIEKENIIELIKKYNIQRISFINDLSNNIFINSYVDHIYIINLEKNRIRKNYIIKLMEKFQINFELIIVPYLTPEEYNIIGNTKINLGEAGCYLSHMFCLNDSIEKKYNRIIIFEDDIVLHKQFHVNFETNVCGLNYDIIMLGANDYSFSKLNYKLVNNNRYIPDKNTKFLYGTHSIMYSNSGFKEMYYARLLNPTFMDNNLNYFLDKFSKSFFILSPNLAVTELSTTSINHNFWITNLKYEKFFYKKCFINFKFTDYNFIYLKPLENCVNVCISKTYKENMEIIIYNFCNNYLISNKIINRLEFNFFNILDLDFILKN